MTDSPIPFRTVTTRLRHEPDKTKGSRHIATVVPVDDPGAAEREIAAVRAEMPDATHHAYAWRVRTPGAGSGAGFRYSDDGEPSGSAGKPILMQIDGRDLTDVLVVVTRYFGGTKLGAGGLVRAYGGAAAEALDLAEIREVIPHTRFEVRHAYEDSGAVAGALSALGLVPVASDYGAAVVLTVSIETVRAEDLVRTLTDATAARAEVHRLDAAD